MNVVHPRLVFFLHHFTFFTSSLMPCFLPSASLHIIQLASSKSVLTVVLFHPFFLEVCSVIVCNFFSLLPFDFVLFFLLVSVSPFSSFCISQVFTPFVSWWQMPNWMMNVLLLCSNWTAVFFFYYFGLASTHAAGLVWLDKHIIARVRGHDVGRVATTASEWWLVGGAVLLSICLLTHTYTNTH